MLILADLIAITVPSASIHRTDAANMEQHQRPHKLMDTTLPWRAPSQNASMASFFPCQCPRIKLMVELALPNSSVSAGVN